eukprot:scaffold40093_cov35-Phaeocystis_antarctica.AAC.1
MTYLLAHQGEQGILVVLVLDQAHLNVPPKVLGEGCELLLVLGNLLEPGGYLARDVERQIIAVHDALEEGQPPWQQLL